MKAIYYNDLLFDNLGYILSDYFCTQNYINAVKKDDIVLDIGAHVGIFSLFALLRGKAKKIYAVEPSIEHFAALSEMIKYNHYEDQIIPIQKAISNKNGTAEFFHIMENRTMFSLHNPLNKPKSDEIVTTITLKTLMDDLKIDHVDLMKMDIEGEEYNILAHSEFDEIAKKIDRIIMELHSWSKMSSETLNASLIDHGFKIERIAGDAFNIFAYKP